MGINLPVPMNAQSDSGGNATPRAHVQAEQEERDPTKEEAKPDEDMYMEKNKENWPPEEPDDKKREADKNEEKDTKKHRTLERNGMV